MSDGRAGIENQVLGLAEAIARLTPADIVTKHLHYAPMFDRLPSALKLWPDRMLRTDSDTVTAPYPDIWIAAGRATIPHSLRMRKRSHGQTLVVQLQDPKADQNAFDLIIAPEHDHLSGPNTLSLIGSTNRMTPDTLAAAYGPWQMRIEAWPRPYVMAAIGGRSKTHDLTPDRAQAMALEIKLAVAELKGSLLLTLSRRTPPEAAAILKATLSDTSGIFFDGDGGNPYFAFLRAADHILVTEDSVNMATEAATTGKPVHILAMDRLKTGGKFAFFHESLQTHGITRPFSGHLDTWTYAPLLETERAAQKVLAVYAEKRARAAVNG